MDTKLIKHVETLTPSVAWEHMIVEVPTPFREMAIQVRLLEGETLFMVGALFCWEGRVWNFKQLEYPDAPPFAEMKDGLYAYKFEPGQYIARSIFMAPGSHGSFSFHFVGDGASPRKVQIEIGGFDNV